MASKSEPTQEQFLRTIFNGLPGGFIELRAIPVDKDQRKVKRIWTKSIKQIAEFGATYGHKDSEYGVYFGVSKRYTEGGAKKDLLGTTCLWVDIDCLVNGQDPNVVLERIGEMPSDLHPSIVVNSGGGLHLYWLLECAAENDALSDTHLYQSHIERYNAALRDIFGGDNVQNVDRIMRLPETYNTKRRPVKRCHVAYCTHHLRHDEACLLDGFAAWGKVLDGEQWVSGKKVQRRLEAEAKMDPLHRFRHVIRGRTVGLLDKWWEQNVREHAPRGYVGIHEAIVISTARLHSAGYGTEAECVEKIVKCIGFVPDLDTSKWDWAHERKVILDTMRTWAQKWKAILKAERDAKENGRT